MESSYKQYKKENGTDISFDEFFSQQVSKEMTFDEYIKEQKEDAKKYFNEMMSKSYTFTYETVNGVFSITEKYTGFAKTLGGFSRQIIETTDYRWSISPENISYASSIDSSVGAYYQRASYNDSTITYTVYKDYKDICKENNLPETIEVPYTENVNKGTVKLKFKDPIDENATAKTLTFTYDSLFYMKIIDNIESQPVDSADINFTEIKPKQLSFYVTRGGPTGSNDYGYPPEIDDDGNLHIKAGSFAMWTYSYGAYYADLSETTEMKIKIAMENYSNDHEDWGGLRFVFFDTNGGASRVDIAWDNIKDVPRTINLSLLPMQDGGDLVEPAYGYDEPADMSKIQKIGISPNAATADIYIQSIKFE